MAIGTNSYGSVAEVEALTKRFTTAGVFDTASTPTLLQVEAMINRISGVANSHLARLGFTIKLDQADAVLAIDELVVSSVVDLVQTANGAGRFFTDKTFRGVSPYRVIMKEVKAWIDGMADGFEALGATRGTAGLENIGFRETDEAGDAVVPLFERKAFGDTRTEWDS